VHHGFKYIWMYATNGELTFEQRKLFTSMSQDIRQPHVYISAVFMSVYRIFATRTSDAVASGKPSLCRQARNFESNDNDKAKIYREIILESSARDPYLNDRCVNPLGVNLEFPTEGLTIPLHDSKWQTRS